MASDIHRADPSMRRITFIVLGLAMLVAVGLVFVFQHWLAQLALQFSTTELVAQLRRMIGFTTFAIGLCLLLIAACAARISRCIKSERRWPLTAARVLRDTPIRRERDAIRIAGWLTAAAIGLIVLALASIALGWRLLSAGA